MGAKYGVSLMCSSKRRAQAMLNLVKADGYGGVIVKNTGRDVAEYPYLVRRSNRPIRKAK